MANCYLLLLLTSCPSVWGPGFLAKSLNKVGWSWISRQDLAVFLFWQNLGFLAEIFAINLAKISNNNQDFDKKSKIMLYIWNHRRKSDLFCIQVINIFQVGFHQTKVFAMAFCGYPHADVKHIHCEKGWRFPKNYLFGFLLQWFESALNARKLDWNVNWTSKKEQFGETFFLLDIVFRQTEDEV